MAKELWFTFYFGALIGLLMAFLISPRVHDYPTNTLGIAANDIVGFLSANTPLGPFAVAVVILAVAISVALLGYTIGKALVQAIEFGIIVIFLGLSGMFLVIIGNGKAVSILGIVFLVVGASICYWREKEAPEELSHVHK